MPAADRGQFLGKLDLSIFLLQGPSFRFHFVFWEGTFCRVPENPHFAGFGHQLLGQ